MARQRRKWIGLLLGVLIFSACSHPPQPSPANVYENVRLKFEQGNLIEVQAEAGRAYHDFAQSPEWASKFRVLQAETLLWRGMNKDALSLLAEPLPATLATDEVAVKRELVQGLATSDSDQAEQSFNKAEQLARANHPRLLGEVTLDRGILLLRQNKYPDSEPLFQNALKVAREESLPFLAASAQVDLGYAAMFQQHYGQAIDWFASALKLSSSIGARALMVKSNVNLGLCYDSIGDLDKALKYLTDARAPAAEFGLQKDELNRLINTGLVHIGRSELEAAQSDYLKALAMAKEADNRPVWAICLNDLTLIAIMRKQFDDAERYNQEALKLTEGNRLSELYALLNDAKIAVGRGKLKDAQEVLQTVVRDSGEKNSLHWLAQAQMAEIDATLKQPSLADRQFREALVTINRARASLENDEYRLVFLSSVISFYDDYIDFLVDRKQNKEALHVVELNRARTLSEGLGIKQEATPLVSQEFHPEKTAQRTGAVILSYRLAAERSYLWAITPSQVAMFVLPAQSRIEEAVHSYSEALAGPLDAKETANASGQELYQMLVAPAQKLISNGSQVIIIPDGSLHELNFETLLVPGQQLHYWIEDVIVTNASSLLLLERAGQKRKLNAKNILLIGDPVSPDPEYRSLPQASSEIEQIQRFFAADQVRVYAGGAATAKAYLDGGPGNFSFIHFVAHGVASRESPLDSAVILSGDESSYKLYAREIIKVRLQADLVTISSCQGAVGRAYGGEGLVGLSWAFLRAGAHQVIAALWNVNDAATPEFMHQFYAGISAGSDPAVALRTAKLSMLHSDSIYRKPFYWAPFQLYKGL